MTVAHLSRVRHQGDNLLSRMVGLSTSTPNANSRIENDNDAKYENSIHLSNLRNSDWIKYQHCNRAN